MTQHTALHGIDGPLSTVHVMSDKMFCRVHYTKTDNTSLYLRLKLAYVFNTWLEEMKDLKFVSVAFKRFPLRSSVSAVVIV